MTSTSTGLAPVEVPTIEIRRDDRLPAVHQSPTTVEIGGRSLGLDPAALVRPGGGSTVQIHSSE